MRSATIITHFAGPHPGFVLSGRSLTEVEKRIDLLAPLVGLGWLATLGGTLVVCLLVQALSKRES